MVFKLIKSRDRIFLSYSPLTTSKAILVWEDFVIAAGEESELKELASSEGYEVIEAGNTLAPGFVDAHAHPDSVGYNTLTGGSLEARDVRDLLKKLQDSHVVLSGWVISPRVNPLGLAEKRLPYSREIDEYINDRPVLIQHVSGHMAALNSKAIEEAVNALGGLKFADLDKGWVYEDDLWRILEYVRRGLSKEDLKKVLAKGVVEFDKRGVTSIGAAGLSLREIEVFEELDGSGDLTTRVYAYVMYDSRIDLEKIPKLVEETWSRPRSRFRINGLKIILDGALGPRTAFLSEPYSDDQSTRGFLNYGFEELVEIFRAASREGFQVAVHVIGDGALDIVLKALKHVGKVKLRLEHVSLVRDDQLNELKAYKPVFVVQPHFIISDKWMSDRVGRDRIRWVYRFRDLMNTGYLALSTDAPVEPIDPILTIYAAISRGIFDGIDYASETLRNSLSIAEALSAYTIGSGVALGDPRLGCLMPGCYADIVEFSENPLALGDLKRLREIKVRRLNHKVK
ncbi:amidohydrolase [Thermogladius sp. 4427co]|uniref:amidohydrolase n=1 Tax=Thermogladius sp. 4427co TaxID=3450718 RepID=UPI003F7AC83B